ncbi:hypothetical protein [Azospirillum halopraeferens]|uniref:hypothetical protein n=1 Tax=Azospirillum halopraeferens TaxID=34010 RepID=UPI00040F7A37|nr:hypothetical protein [Azospirillum halopraeferens]
MLKLAMPALAALFVTIPAARGQTPPPAWMAEVPSGRVAVTIERTGGRDALVVSVQPANGVSIQPAVLRIDAPALMRDRLAGKFPAAVRGSGRGGALRVSFPVARPGAVRFGTPDSNDGMLRVEYRYCPPARPTCAVERVDVALKMGD